MIISKSKNFQSQLNKILVIHFDFFKKFYVLFLCKKNFKEMFQKLKKLYCKNYFLLRYTLKESHKSYFFIISVSKKALYNYLLNDIFFKNFNLLP